MAGNATLEEALAAFPTNDENKTTLRGIFGQEVLALPLIHCFTDGKTDGELESHVEKQVLTIGQSTVARVFIKYCSKWTVKEFKRAKFNTGSALHKSYDSLAAPSAFAKIDVWQLTQKKGDPKEILCLRPSECSWVDVRIMHPVFDEVIQLMQHGDPKPPDLACALELMAAMASGYPEEGYRRGEINGVLQKHIFSPAGLVLGVKYLGEKVQTDGSGPGINIEYKNEKGEGGGTPYFENLAYFIKSTKQGDGLGRHCCPFLLIEICGCEMAVFGAVWACGKPCAQPLTPALPFLSAPISEEINLLQARLCMALRHAVTELGTFYASAGALPESDPQAEFPYPRIVKLAGVPTKLEYRECLGDSELRKMVYLATMEGVKELVVVKFTSSYSKDAHEVLAAKGLAPNLYCVEDVAGVKMVVMEYLSDTRAWNDAADRTNDMVASQLDEVLRLLEKENLVHGDLRKPNILVKDTDAGPKVFIVDFDWAGQADVATYPKYKALNPNVTWPDGAGPGAPITTEHDRYMVDVLLGRGDD